MSNKKDKLLKDVYESLKDLYEYNPKIAGEYFGACLTDRLEEVVRKIKK